MQSYSILLFLPLLSVFLLIKNICKLITSHNSHLLHKRVTRNLLRQRRFLGIWALWWTIMYNTRKKVPAGKNLQFFFLEVLKKLHFKWGIYNDFEWPKSGHFFRKLGYFFRIFEKGHGKRYIMLNCLDIATKWFRWTVEKCFQLFTLTADYYECNIKCL